MKKLNTYHIIVDEIKKKESGIIIKFLTKKCDSSTRSQGTHGENVLYLLHKLKASAINKDAAIAEIKIKSEIRKHIRRHMLV
jgi:hypothetical protein